MVKFRGTERINIIDKRFINTTICEALKEIELFFNRNTRVRSEINGFRREDIDEYPYEAIREAVVNAIAHRDYNIKGSPISFLIFSDRIEITSPGGLVPPLTIDELGKKIVHRNNHICKLLEKTRYMEIIGSGIPRMREKMKEFNLPEVEFIEKNGFFEVIFRNSKKINIDEFKLNHRQSEVLKLLKTKKEINLNEYVKIFSISKTTASRDLKELNNLKYINKILINGKQIKYVLNPTYINDFS
ncbi:MAG: DeoR family transcriptional regulator [Methanobrevibacter sp.]|jgi:predicted HTH transcriptional regulator|nr:DeoR family transcriptional regulator [Candidatus Methanovirga meridionalis]